MSAFDDLTLGEVEEMTTIALKGQTWEQADPLMLAGAVMWITQRKSNPQLEWDAFKANTRMGDIKAFSIQLEADALDPTQAQTVPMS